MFERLRDSFSKLISKIAEVELKPENLNPLLQEFKFTLIENDVAVTVADYICDEIERRLSGLRVGRLADRKSLIKNTLKAVSYTHLTLPTKA